MKAEIPNGSNRIWRMVRPLVGKALPLWNRDARLDALDEQQRRGKEIALETVWTVSRAWWDHGVAAFNHWGFLLESALVVFCLSRSTLPWAAVFANGAVLLALAWRGAYIYHDPLAEAQPLLYYYVESAKDAVVAGVFLMASQMLLLSFSPSLALPGAVLYRGGVVCMPLLAALRAVLRPKPEAKLPFNGGAEDAEKIYNRVWWLNILWLFSFYGIVVQNTSDDPHSLADPVRGWCFYPLVVWIVIQSDALSRKFLIETLRYHYKVNRLRRKLAWLAQGMKKGQPLYGWYIGLQVLVWMVAAVELGEGIWPWLSGQSPDVAVFRAVGGVVTFTMSVVMWTYVKESNKAAAGVLQAAVGKELEKALAW